MTDRTPTSVLLAAITSILLATGVAHAFTGAGAGIEGDPYIITTVDQLQEMQDELDACYELGNNINCAATTAWNAGAGFEPVGLSPDAFTGTLDGNNNKLVGLFINRPDISFGVGLFGFIDDGCELINIGLENVQISGDRGTGGLVGGTGMHADVVISNCWVTGTVSGEYGVAGLIGFNRGGAISYCYSTATVSGDGDIYDYVGGLVGISGQGATISHSYSTGDVFADGSRSGGFIASNTGTITECFSTGNVHGGHCAGGFVGDNGTTTVNGRQEGYIADCYATGDVSGTGWVGGFAGINEGLDTWTTLTSTITKSYSAGNVTGTSDVGGFVGFVRPASQITACYWDTMTSGQPASAGGTGKTTAEMKALAIFTRTGWDFAGEIANGTEDIWRLPAGDYPRLAFIVSLPYTENFSSGKPDYLRGWEYYSNYEGRIQVVGGWLRMDDTTYASAYSLNEAILHLNLSRQSNVALTLDHLEHGDEDTALPPSFTGHCEGDGISISADGITWYRLINLTSNFIGGSFDLDSAIRSAGIDYTSDFQIKFQQYDDYPYLQDGRSFDNISITSTPPALLGHWKLDDNASNTTVVDSSGNANDGIARRNTSGISLPGPIGGSLDFDGSGDWIDVPDAPEWSFDDFTITVWVKFDSLNPKWWESAFVGQDSGGGPRNKWIFSYDPSDQKTVFHINNPGTGSALIKGNTWTAETGVWYFAGVSRRGSLYTFYLYGLADGSAVSSVAIPDVPAPLTIGWAEGSGKFHGAIDDVRIYSEALPQADIESLCNLAPAAHWKMDDDAGSSTVVDSVGGAGNGAARSSTSALSTGGVIGGALTFDGSVDYVAVPDAAIGWAFEDDFSITLWSRFDSFNPKWWESAFLAQDSGGGPANKWIFSYSTTSQRTLFHINGVCTGGPVITGEQWIAEAGAWYFVGLSRSGNTYTFYRQGVPDGSQVNSALFPDVAAPLTIGWAEGLGGKFDGAIDDVRIYDRALSDLEMEAVCDAGPAAYWKMDDDAAGTTVIDSIGRGNDGDARRNTDDLTTAGAIDTALSFNSTTDYIVVPEQLEWVLALDFTISLWARFDSLNPQWWESAFASQDSGGGPADKWIFSYDPISQRSLFHINGSGTGAPLITSNPWTAETGQWYFIALSRTADGTYTFYHQNACDGSQVNAEPIPDVPGPWRIGWAEGDDKFDGAIDDVRVHNRVLSHAELSGLYAEVVGPIAPAKPLLGHWTMDDNASNPSVQDSSGIGNHGTARRNTSNLTTAGVTGTALNFNGTTDYVSVPDRALRQTLLFPYG